MNRAILCVVVASTLLAVPRQVAGEPTVPQEPIKCGTTADFTQYGYNVPFSIHYDSQGNHSWIDLPYGPGNELECELYSLFPGGCDACPEDERCYASMWYWGTETYVDTTRFPSGGWSDNYVFTGKFWLECYDCDW